MAQQDETPWHAAFPAPTTTAPTFAKDQLLRFYQMLGDILEAGMLLIDLRRIDYEGGTIRGSLNIPAQSFYMNMATLYRLCRGDGVNVISRVLFYCGSSSGRAPRCAAWFQEYVAQRAKADETTEEPQCFVLEGGIKGWVNGGQAYEPFMEGFFPEYWRQFAPTPGVAANKRTADDDQGDEDVSMAESPSKRRDMS